jgi:hypothetical protein
MNTPYGLEIVENCQNCRLKREECFCNLSPPALKHFSAISHQTTYPSEATLFVEGQTPRGVFLLCSGKVKLSTSSRDGKVLILKMAGAGEMLGLSAVISGTEYELTAETAMPCQVNFVPREPLLDLLRAMGSGTALGAGAEPGVSVGLPGYSRPDPGALVGGEVGQAVAFLDPHADHGEQHERNPGSLWADA